MAANLGVATFIAIVGGVDVFFSLSNPLVSVAVGLGVGIESIKMSGKIKLLAIGAVTSVTMRCWFSCFHRPILGF